MFLEQVKEELRALFTTKTLKAAPIMYLSCLIRTFYERRLSVKISSWALNISKKSAERLTYRPMCQSYLKGGNMFVNLPKSSGPVLDLM